MVYRHHSCYNPKFKEYIKHKHKNCYKTKPVKFVLGRNLNSFNGIGLTDDIEYRYVIISIRVYNTILFLEKERKRILLLYQQSKLDLVDG